MDEHRKHLGPEALANYAEGIKIHRVIIHSSLKSSYQLLIKIIDSMFKSGAVMENGKICMNLFRILIFCELGKQLVIFITCGCESSAPFFGILKAGRIVYATYDCILLKAKFLFTLPMVVLTFALIYSHLKSPREKVEIWMVFTKVSYFLPSVVMGITH